VVLLTAGGRCDKKVEKFAGFWTQIASRVLNSRNIRRENIKSQLREKLEHEQAEGRALSLTMEALTSLLSDKDTKLSAFKTDVEALKTNVDTLSSLEKRMRDQKTRNMLLTESLATYTKEMTVLAEEVIVLMSKAKQQNKNKREGAFVPDRKVYYFNLISRLILLKEFCSRSYHVC
jgi:DNA polymerase III delta prime subunit